MESISTAEMKRLEDESERKGVSKLQLMENAGKAAAEFIASKAKEGSRITVFCGTGNNGGDGFVCARHLSQKGFEVEVVLAGEGGTAEAKPNFEKLNETKVRVKEFGSRAAKDSAVVVDALLGTGIKGGLREPVRSMVEGINNSNALKISLDVPTGVDPDTGETAEPSVKPDYTVTFHKAKKGMCEENSGKIMVAGIGVIE